MPFWQRKALHEMSASEWESLCDGCGRCCLIKLEDEDTGDIHLTNLSCRLLDVKSCRCRDYPNRQSKMPDCVTIDAESVGKLGWLPNSCAYRRLAEGRGLAWWHPLVSGTADTVQEAGFSVLDWVRSEAGVKETAFHHYIIDGFPEEAYGDENVGEEDGAVDDT
jgi:uncharacterized protein